MAVTLVMALYGIALVELLVRRPAQAENRPDETTRSSSERSLWRPLIPTYRFFDSIGEPLWLGIRESGETTHYRRIPAPPRRRAWFLFQNWRENLWLFEQGLLPDLARRLESTDNATVNEAEEQLKNLLVRNLKTQPHWAASPYDCALFVGTGPGAQLLWQLTLHPDQSRSEGQHPF